MRAQIEDLGLEKIEPHHFRANYTGSIELSNKIDFGTNRPGLHLVRENYVQNNVIKYSF